MKTTLNQVLKGMKVESWEQRVQSNGSCKVYVRFAKAIPDTTVTVNPSTTDNTNNN